MATEEDRQEERDRLGNEPFGVPESDAEHPDRENEGEQNTELPVSESEPGHSKLPEVEREAVSLTPEEEEELKEDIKAAESEGMTPPEVETPEAPSDKGTP